MGEIKMTQRMKKVTYSSKNSSKSISLYVTEDQERALNKLQKQDEFSAIFWAEKVDWLNNGDRLPDGNRAIRYNGEHNVTGDGKGAFKGHGGARFEFEVLEGDFKGDKIVTNDLWHQGDIPEELQNILKDNVLRL